MREETSAWLTPMLEASEQLDPGEVQQLMRDASMPVREAGQENLDGLADEGVVQRAIDWVRFGQLLRDRLGWDDYPDAPPSPN